MNKQAGARALAARLAFPGLFVLSGGAGLVYEVVWMRQFSTILGASNLAVTMVLASFMCGLGLGSWIFGRMVDRVRSGSLLRAYAFLEAGIGAYALVLPFLLKGMEGAFVAFFRAAEPGMVTANLVRLLLSFLLLLFPTCLMGGTLPIMTRYLLERRESLGNLVSALYASNAAGAILGVMLSGFWLLPVLGIRKSSLAAAAVNFLVAAAALAFRGLRAGPPPAPAKPVPGEGTDGAPETAGAAEWERWAYLAAYAISGAAAMMYEVVWTRTLSMIIGTTTYAFTVMLATYIAGLALGGAAYAWIGRRVAPRTLFWALQCAVGISALLSIPAFEKLPVAYLLLRAHWFTSWADLQVLRFLLAAAVMIVPTVALGMMFPTASALCVGRRSKVGGGLGALYGWNTAGAIAGTMAAGFLLIPLIGLERTMAAAALLNLGIASALLLLRDPRPVLPWAARAAAPAAAGLVLLAFLKPWSPLIINSGVYVYHHRYLEALARYREAEAGHPGLPFWSDRMVLEAAMNKPRLLHYETGRAATVAVMEEESGVRFLTVNGKTDASAGKSHDMKTQVMLGHLPMLLHGDPRRVLMVGLGSGISAGSVLAHGVGTLDCAEISPAVISASRHFREFNRGALDDPRLRVAQRDARNFLLTAREGYDVIISQPSNPWIEGESNLFTGEWYRLAHSSLKEGGMMLQWLPAYLMSEEDFRTILHTFRTVFPSLTLWASGSPGDVFLLAAKGGPVRPDLEAVRARLAEPEIRGDIARTGLDPDGLLPALFRMGPLEVAGYIAAGGGEPGMNTDDLPLTEFTTPKQLVRRGQVGGFGRDGSGDVEGDWISMMQAGAALPDEGASAGPAPGGEEG